MNGLFARPQMTLDEKHTLMMNDFAQIEAAAISNAAPNRLAEVHHKKNKYLLQNATYIFEYFEKKQNVGMGVDIDKHASTDTTPSSHRHFPTATSQPSSLFSRNCNHTSSRAINAFFKILPEQSHPSTVATATETTDETKTSSSSSSSSSSSDTAAAINTRTRRMEIRGQQHSGQSQFWANMAGHAVVPTDEYAYSADICVRCHEGELIQLEEEGMLTCKICGAVAHSVVDAEKPSYKEPPGEVSYTAYMRLNHFKEILAQFQAKETTQIDEHVMEAVRRRMKKERIQNSSQITYTRTREILRLLGYNKYFEHVQYINCKFGVTPPTMNEALVETLCVLFVEIQAPWARHCPPSRQNFFGYNYVLHQLCKLVGADEFCPFIPLLKDPQKANDQDDIWRKVCADLGWLYIPSPRP
jgi:cytochrome c553